MAEPVSLAAQLLGLGQQPTAGDQQLLACRGERDPAGVMALQQLHVQGPLEVGERGRIADWDRWTCAAAPVMLPDSATATKYSSWRSVYAATPVNELVP